ncbi:MAG: hypothetical protein EXX96DRAFT_561214 [Benjaminiella poitrasii]|nr:MAG: hypothetical protein EXX96DRAFT_561214 [Benjaminiella poitrasii]
MLRVYSVLYIERLWNNKLIPEIESRQLQSSSYSPLESCLVDNSVPGSSKTIKTIEIQKPNSVTDESANLQDEISQEVFSVDKEEGNYKSEPIETVDIIIESNSGDKTVNPSDSNKEEKSEVISLAIETDTTESQKIEEEEEALTAMNHATSLSSSSSTGPPLTPSSMHSIEDNQESSNSNNKPRTTSLIRRETSKFNERRRSLTKKLKRALTVKMTNKRNSV